MDTVLVRPFDSYVHIQVRDPEGNIVDERTGKNAETIWAKLHAPVSPLRFDFIVQPYSMLMNANLPDFNATAFEAADKIRGYVFAGKDFSYNSSTKTYTVTFTYTNNEDYVLKIYGLVSYYGKNLYTIFDMSTSPIEVPPNYVVSGTYRIHFSDTTPSVPPDGTYSVSTITSNSIVSGIIPEVGASVREYKYTRLFVKTSEYMGVDTSDTGVTSYINTTVTSSDWLNRAFGDIHTGEIFYKCLQSGSPGGAKVVRYLKYYSLRGYSDVCASGVVWKSVSDVSHATYSTYTPLVQYIDVKLLENRNVQEVRPWKFKFPSTVSWIQQFGFVRNSYTSGEYFGTYIGLSAPFRHIYSPGEYKGVMQSIMYLYWSDSPTFNFYVYSYRGSSYVHVEMYINGAKYTPSSIQQIRYEYDTRLFKVDFDLSSLSAGEGIVILKVWYDYDLFVYNRSDHGYRVKPVVYCIESDMWGYCVPYAGFLEEGSSEINSNWISSGMVNFSGVDIDCTFIVDESNVSNIQLVQNTPLDELQKMSPYQYWVWVKQSEFDKLVGRICDTGYAKVCAYQFYGHNNCGSYHFAPVYLVDGSFVWIKPFIKINVSDWATYSGVEGIYNDLFSLTHNNHIKADHANRSVEFLDDYPFDPLGQTSTYDINVQSISTWKSYITREQGDSSYDYRIPAQVSDYTEGNATVTHDGVVYEFETVWETSEHIKYLTVTSSTDSVFSVNEYFSFPVVDQYGLFLTDALEVWKRYTSQNFLSTELSPIEFENTGTDELFNDPTSDSQLFVNNLVVTHESEVLEVDSSIKVAPNATHMFSVIIPYVENEKARFCVAVPKVFEEGGVDKYVNIESVVVTDGEHVIPWNLDMANMFGADDDLPDELYKKSWVIVLNSNTLKQLVGKDGVSTNILLHVYFEARRKDEILPLEIEVETHYRPPFGKNDSHSAILLDAYESGTIENKANYLTADQIQFSVNNVEVTAEHMMKFNPPNSSYISFDSFPSYENSVDNFLPPLDRDWTLDLWVKLNSLPADDSCMFIVEGARHWDADGEKMFGPRLAVYKNRFVFVMHNGWSQDSLSAISTGWEFDERHIAISSDEITTGQWYYIVLTGSEGYVRMYVNGKLQGGAVAYNQWRNFIIGTYFNKDNYFLDGEIRWIHFSLCTRWYNEHTPPPLTSSWDKVEEWSDVAIPEGEAVIKVVLPYALDEKVDVLDEQNNHVDFCHLREIFEPVDSTSYGHIFFIKTPEIKYTSRNVDFVSVRQFPAAIADTYIGDLFMSKYRGVYCESEYSAFSTCFGEGASHTTFVMDNLPFTYQQSPFDYYDSVEAFPVPNRFKLKIVESSTNESSDPELVLSRYIKPSSVDMYVHTKFSWSFSEKVSRTIYETETYTDGQGLLFELPNSTTLEFCINSGYVKPGTFPVPYMDKLYGTEKDSVNTVFRIDFTAGCTDFGPSEGIDLMYRWNEFSRGRALLIYSKTGSGRNISFRKLISYYTLKQAAWDYQFLGICSREKPGDFVVDVFPIWATRETGIQSLDSAGKCLCLMSANDASRDVACFSLDIDQPSLKVLTFVVDDFDAMYPYYKNYTGHHVLSTTNEPLRFLVMHTYTNSKLESRIPAFMYTRNSEFASLISSGALSIPMTEVGFVSDTELPVLPEGTPFSTVPTETIVIKRRAVRQHEYNPIVTTPGMYFSVYSDGVAGFRFLCKARSRASYPVWRVYGLGGYNSENWFNWCRPHSVEKGSDSSEPVFLLHPYLYFADYDSILTHWVYRLRLQFLPDIRQQWEYTVSRFPMKLVTEGSTEAPAAWVDIRIAPYVNLTHNVIWSTEGIPVSKVISFGTFSLIGSTTVPDCQIYPLIKFKNTSTQEEKIYILTKGRYEPEEITEKLTQTQLENPANIAQFPDLYATPLSFEPFDSLRSLFSGSDWVFFYGWLIVCQSSTDSLFILRSISVQPSFNDTSLYDEVPFCYGNKKYEILSDNHADLLPDVDNYKVKVYNPSPNTQVQVPTKLDLREINLSSYTQGIVAYVDGNPIPTVYEISKEGHLGNDFLKFRNNGTGCVWVKVPSIDGLSSLDIELRNEANSYSPTDVFDDYYAFDTFDSSAWEVLQSVPIFTGTVSDVDAGPGMTSTSDRIAGCEVHEVYTEDGNLVFNTTYPVVLRAKFAADVGKVWEYGYTADTGVEARVYYTESEPVFQEELVPYYHFAGLTFVRLDKLEGEVELEVYFDSATADDASDYNTFNWWVYYQSGFHYNCGCISHGSGNRFYAALCCLPVSTKNQAYVFVADQRGGYAVDSCCNEFDSYTNIVHTVVGDALDVSFQSFKSHIVSSQLKWRFVEGATVFPAYPGVYETAYVNLIGISRTYPYQYLTHTEDTEQGNWTVDGHEFSKRVKVKITVPVHCDVDNIVIPLKINNLTGNEIRIIRKYRTDKLFKSVDFICLPLSSTPYSVCVESTEGVSVLEDCDVFALSYSDAVPGNLMVGVVSDLSGGQNDFYVYYGSSDAPTIRNVYYVVPEGTTIDDEYYKLAQWMSLVQWSNFKKGTTNYVRWSDTNYYQKVSEVIYPPLGIKEHIHFRIMDASFDDWRSDLLYGVYYKADELSKDRQTLRQKYVLGGWSYSVNSWYSSLFTVHTRRRNLLGKRTNLPWSGRRWGSPVNKYIDSFANSVGVVTYSAFMGLYTWRGYFDTYVKGYAHFEIYPHAAAYELSYSDEETGSWTIDSYTFTKRRKLVVHSQSEYKQAVFYFPHVLCGCLDYRLKVQRVSYKGSALYNHPTSSPTCVSFSAVNRNMYVRVTPVSDVTNWILESWEREHIDVKKPSNTSKINIAVNTGQSKTFKLHWIRSYNKPDKQLVQLMKEDFCLVVKNMHSTWYLIDYSEAGSPDLNTINQHIQDTLKQNRSVQPCPKFIPFIHAGVIGKGIVGVARTFKYNLHDD